MSHVPEQPARTLRAAWVCPMDGPPVRDAVVTFTDRVVSVAPAGQARGPVDVDLGDATVLPGLVNPHTHLELSGLACDGERSASFTDWIIGLRARLGPGPDFAAATRRGVAQCLRFGVTTVGDVSQQTHVTRPALRGGPLRVVSYGEVLGLAKLKARYDELLPRAIDPAHATDRLRVGLTPHAPYTVDEPSYRECVRLARAGSLPLATHLAELPYEVDFLAGQSGPFRDLWEKIGSWADPVHTFRGGSPVAFARAVGLLDHAPALLAHVNYADDADLATLAAGRASVVYCPRTHAYFGHPPHRWREMLARGVNVAVGTDSCASSPDLNLVDDLRLVHRAAPDVPAATLWEMATTRAARALGVDREAGTLTPGKAADFAVFPVAGDDPLTAILTSHVCPTETWIAGHRVPPDEDTAVGTQH